MTKHAHDGAVSAPTATTVTALHDDDHAVSGPTGLARIGAMRKVVNAFIKRSRLEISSLHISQPDASGMVAKGKIRLTHLGNGPVPLVGLRVKFNGVQGASLHWTPYGGGRSSSSTDTDTVVQVYIEPLTMQPSTPGSVSSEVDMRFVMHDGTHASFVQFVKHMIRSDPLEGTRILLKADGVQIKAFGLKFGGLHLEKDVVLGGLGCLGGALIFDDDTGTLPRLSPSVVPVKEQHASLQRQRSSNTLKRLAKFGRRSKSSSSPSRAKDFSPPKTPSTIHPTPQPKSAGNRLEIGDMDIVGGDPKRGLQVTASVVLENPARKPELIVEPGELRFALCVVDPKGAEEPAAGSRTAFPPGYIRIGVMKLAPMVLRPGLTKVQATGNLIFPAPPDNDDDLSDQSNSVTRAYRAGQQLIARILQNERVDLCAIATRYDDADPQSGVSTVGWLAEAFEGTRIDARIPPLGKRVRLLDGAELRVEGGDGGAEFDQDVLNNDDDIGPSEIQGSLARASLRNGFGAEIHVHDLTVRACSEPLIGEDGQTEVLELGVLSSPSDIQWQGLTLRRDQPTHVSLPMEINPDGRVLIEILRKSARKSDVNLGNPLTELLEDLRKAHWTEAGFDEPPKSRPASSFGETSRRSSLATEEARRKSVEASQHGEPSEDLAALLANALANLRVTAHVQAVASLGGYRMPGKLEFEQRNLPIALSTATAAALLPLVGKPFVKAMVDRAEVDVLSIDIMRMDDRGIQACVALQVLNFGPLSASVVFDNGLHLRHAPLDAAHLDRHASTIAILQFEGPVSVYAGCEDPVQVDVRIVPATGADASDKFSKFVSGLLQADSVTYFAHADPLSITSGGVHFRASLEKAISINGLGGFSGLRMNDLQIVGETSAPAAGVSLSVAAPVNAAQPSAIAFQTVAQVRNNGDIHMRLSKLEVAIAIDGVQIGQANIDDVDLKSGGAMANLRVKGVLYAPPAREAEAHEKALQTIGALIEGLLAGREMVVQVLGRRAWVPDAHAGGRSVSLAWLDAALRTFKTDAAIQWKGGVPIVDKIDVGQVEATFAARKKLQLKIDDITASYSVPFPIQFELLGIDASMDIMYGDKSIGKCHALQESIEQVGICADRRNSAAASSVMAKSFSSSSAANGFAGHAGSSSSPPPSPSSIGHVRSNRASTASSIRLPNTPLPRRPSNATTASTGSRLASFHQQSSSTSAATTESSTTPTVGKVKLSLKAFDLETSQDDVLGDMIEHVFHAGPSGTNKITLRGAAHVKVKTVLGVLQLSVTLGVDHSLDLSGLDGLRNSPLRYTDFDIVSANAKYIQIKMNIHSHNPSTGLTINVPDSSLSLSAYYNGAFLGDVVIGGDGKGLALVPGTVSLPGVEFRYRPTSSSEEAVRPVISRLFSGQPVELSIRGHRSSSVNAALVQALRLVDVPIEISPLGKNDLLSLIRVQLGLSVVTSNSIDATYYLDNPIGLPIDVLRLEVNATYNGKPFGNATKTYHKEGKQVGRVTGGTPAIHSTPPTHSPANGKVQQSAEASRRTSTSSINPMLQRLLLPPGARKFEGALVVRLAQPLDQLVKAFLLERGNIILDVELRACLDIQEYVIPHFVYHQKVPLEVQGLQGVAKLLRLM